MLKNIFRKKKEEKLKENQVRVVLPEESFVIAEYKNEDLPCIAVINSSLKNFEHREIFAWHLSVIIDFDEDEIIDNGMPSEEERAVVDPFCEKLDEEIKAGGNALFLVRETWNKTRRLVWMVYNPDIAHEHLQFIIQHSRHPRPFDYRMEQDLNWEQPEWYLRNIKD